MTKFRLYMQVELDIDGYGTYDNIKEATLKMDFGDVETGLVNTDDNIIEALESNKMSRDIGLMGMFVDILNRGEA